MKQQALIIIFIVSIVSFIISGQLLAKGSGTVFDTKHNLSISGKGDIKTNAETRVCIFCHGSHNTSAEGPLWNHETTSPGKFRTYDRGTLQGTAQQPTGSTKLCLSCHDGTIAVGAIKGLPQPLPMSNTTSSGRIPDGAKGHIGTNLSGTHPVSITYNQETALAVEHIVWPPVDPEHEVGPDKTGLVQCTSCHDPHDDSKSEKYPFWKKETFSEVCLTCHKF